MTRTDPVHPSLKTGWSQRKLLIINRRNKFLNADPLLTDMSLSMFRLAGNTVFPAEKPVRRARLTGFLPETPDGSLKLTSRRLRESFFRCFAARMRQKPDTQNQRETHRLLSPGIDSPGKPATPDRIRSGIRQLENGVSSHQPYASGDGSVPGPPWMGGTGNREDSLENRRSSDLAQPKVQRWELDRLFRKDSICTNVRNTRNFSLQMTAIV